MKAYPINATHGISRRRLLRNGTGMVICLSSVGIAACEAHIPLGDDDDSIRLQTALDEVHRTGGHTLKLVNGTIYTCRHAPVVPEGITFDLNGATIALMLNEGNDRGVRLRSRSTLCNGTIRVDSRGTPSLQAGVHAPVCVGPIYGEGGTASSPSPDENVSGWSIRDLVLSSDKTVDSPNGPLGAVAIQITGNASDGVIERITVPDSDRMSGAIHLDWGVIGPITSRDDLAGLNASRRAFDAGTSWTTHPHDIAIRNIYVGRLTGGAGGPDGGSDAIRLSGCYRVSVRNVRAAATSGVFLRHTAGDLGLEFSQLASLDGNRFTNCIIDDCLGGQMFVSDNMADNVARGTRQGYKSRRPVVLPTDVVFDQIEGNGRGGSSGGLFLHQSGGRATRCQATGFVVGFRVDAGVRGVTLDNCIARGNRSTGFLVEHPEFPPFGCVLSNPVAIDNGTAGGDANIVIGAWVGTTISGGTIGNNDRPDRATYGVRIKQFSDGCKDATIDGQPYVASHAKGGAAFAVSSDEGWGALRLFTGARYGPLVERRWVGLSIVPVRIDTYGRVFSVARRRDMVVPKHFPSRDGDRFVPAPTD